MRLNSAGGSPVFIRPDLFRPWGTRRSGTQGTLGISPPPPLCRLGRRADAPAARVSGSGGAIVQPARLRSNAPAAAVQAVMAMPAKRGRGDLNPMRKGSSPTIATAANTTQWPISMSRPIPRRAPRPASSWCGRADRCIEGWPGHPCRLSPSGCDGQPCGSPA